MGFDICLFIQEMGPATLLTLDLNSWAQDSLVLVWLVLAHSNLSSQKGEPGGSEFGDSLDYRVSSMTARTAEKPCLQESPTPKEKKARKKKILCP